MQDDQKAQEVQDDQEAQEVQDDQEVPDEVNVFWNVIVKVPLTKKKKKKKKS